MFSQLIILLIYLLDFINSLQTSQKYARYAHASTLIDGKLYFMFGNLYDSRENEVSSRDLFYLDVSKSFTNSLPSLVDIQSNLPATIVWSTSSAGGINRSTIFSFGGYLKSVSSGQLDTNDFVFTFKTPDGPWQKASISGTPPTPVVYAAVKSVVDENGKMYLFGGDLTGVVFYNSMYILDTINLMWTKSIDAPSNRSQAASVLLKTGEIWYIGGSGGTSGPSDINTILVYNTNYSKWSTTIVGGPYIDSRFHHTAILAPDGKIIIYGGIYGWTVMAQPVMVLLDTKTSPYSWTIPNIPSANSPPPLLAHTANLVENYMIIAFGISNLYANNSSKLSDEIYLFDTHTYTWTTTFNPSNSTSNSQTSNVIYLIGTSVGAITATIILIIAVGFLIYRYRKKHQYKNVYPTTGNIG